jgi:hypothetical protein
VGEEIANMVRRKDSDDCSDLLDGVAQGISAYLSAVDAVEPSVDRKAFTNQAALMNNLVVKQGHSLKGMLLPQNNIYVIPVHMSNSIFRYIEKPHHSTLPTASAAPRHGQFRHGMGEGI